MLYLELRILHIYKCSTSKGSIFFKPNPRVLQERSTELGNLKDDLTCSRDANAPLYIFTVHERYSAEVKDSDEGFTYVVELHDGPAASCFERDGDQTVTDFAELCNKLSKPDSELSRPHASVIVCEILESIKIANPSSEFAKGKNTCIQKLEEDEEEKTTIFFKLIWCHLYVFFFFKDHIIKNSDKVIVNIARGGFTGCAAKLHTFLNSDLVKVYLQSLFGQLELRPFQVAVATKLATKLYEKFLGNLVKIVSQSQEADQPIRFDVAEISGPGKAKFRHVSGWAVRKVLENE